MARFFDIIASNFVAMNKDTLLISGTLPALNFKETAFENFDARWKLALAAARSYCHEHAQGGEFYIRWVSPFPDGHDEPMGDVADCLLAIRYEIHTTR